MLLRLIGRWFEVKIVEITLKTNSIILGKDGVYPNYYLTLP